MRFIPAYIGDPQPEEQSFPRSCLPETASLAQILEKEKGLQCLSNPLKRLCGNRRDRASLILLDNFQQGSNVDEEKVAM